MLKALKIILDVQEIDMQMIQLMRLKAERIKDLSNINSVKTDLRFQAEAKAEDIAELKIIISILEGELADIKVKIKKLESQQNAIKKVMDKPYSTLNETEIKALKMLKVSGWDMIQANSGGHKCITNISGLMYFGKQGVPYLKDFQAEFEKELRSKILTNNPIEGKELITQK